MKILIEGEYIPSNITTDLLIKGMEMPSRCIDCPFMVSRDNDDCILQSGEANEGFENWEQMKAGCPLVEVEEYQAVNDKTGEVKKCWTEVK